MKKHEPKIKIGTRLLFTDKCSKERVEAKVVDLGTASIKINHHGSKTKWCKVEELEELEILEEG